jgi:hypothetical protein
VAPCGAAHSSTNARVVMSIIWRLNGGLPRSFVGTQGTKSLKRLGLALCGQDTGGVVVVVGVRTWGGWVGADRREQGAGESWVS